MNDHMMVCVVLFAQVRTGFLTCTVHQCMCMCMCVCVCPSVYRKVHTYMQYIIRMIYEVTSAQRTPFEEPALGKDGVDDEVKERDEGQDEERVEGLHLVRLHH